MLSGNGGNRQNRTMRVTSAKRLTADKTHGASGKSSPVGANRFEIPSAPPPTASTPTARLSPVAQLDAIIALQSVGSVAGERKRAVAQGTAVLDLLDDLKVQLLSGQISNSHIGQLTGIVKSRPEYKDDARLRDLLDHIDLRARVELAKLGRSLP